MGHNRRMIPATILVVDDDSTIRDLVNEILSKRGFDVVAVSSGEEALKTASQKRPDLVLMDIGMPEMDGYETTRRLKKEPGLDSVPVIFLSGKSAEEDAGRSFKQGGLTFMRKPFSPKALSDLVELTLQSLGIAHARG